MGCFPFGILRWLLSLILEGRTPPTIHPLFFGANLTALTKKSGEICSIAVGCTLRRLVAKCACLHALESIPALLSPHPLGFCVPGGADAAVHGAHIYLSQMPNNKALLKVDFRNTFNSIRRDKMWKLLKHTSHNCSRLCIRLLCFINLAME